LHASQSSALVMEVLRAGLAVPLSHPEFVLDGSELVYRPGGLAGFLRRETGALLIDGIGTWLAAMMTKLGAWSGPPAGGQLAAGIDELVRAWRETSALVVAVSDEVGSGLVPEYPAGRQFRDQLGWLNQRLAAESELTLLVTAGKTVAL